MLAERANEKLLVVIDDGINEEAEKIFNDIWEVLRRHVVHDSEEGNGLLFEELVDCA